MRVAVNGSRLYFDVEGVGIDTRGEHVARRPTLLLLHGSPGNSDHSVFKPWFRELTDVAQIVYLDLRGSGRSDEPADSAHSLEAWADDVAAFCDTLGIERPVVLGNSAGGMVAAMYAIRHPDHPAKVVLSSTQARLDPERCLAVFERLGGSEARTAARRALIEEGDLASFADYARTCMPLYNRVPNPNPRHSIFREPCATAFHELGGIWHTMDFLADLSAIRCPTLVLAGEDDPVTPIEDSEDIVEHLDPSIVRFERFDRAGHGVWIDDAPRAFAVVREFLSS